MYFLCFNYALCNQTINTETNSMKNTELPLVNS